MKSTPLERKLICEKGLGAHQTRFQNTRASCRGKNYFSSDARLAEKSEGSDCARQSRVVAIGFLPARVFFYRVLQQKISHAASARLLICFLMCACGSQESDAHLQTQELKKRSFLCRHTHTRMVRYENQGKSCLIEFSRKEKRKKSFELLSANHFISLVIASWQCSIILRVVCTSCCCRLTVLLV